MLLTEDQKDFISASPLLFIASRSKAGLLDVSPRAGQPSTLRVDEDGRLLLPDVRGNRRLDTLGNVLADPNVTLLLVREGEDRFLRIRATAQISTAPEVLARFPADETPALSVMILTPDAVEMVETDAFRRAGFWVGPEGRKAPLDGMAILKEDRAYFDAAGAEPVPKAVGEESMLTSSGLRDSYGFPSQLVREKGMRGIGPGAMRYIRDVRLLVVARPGDRNPELDLVAEGVPERIAGGDALRLPRPSDISLEPAGEVGVLLVAPGRTDLMRLNGTYRATNRDLELHPREVYLHCAASLSRARIWQGKPPLAWSGRRLFVCEAVRTEASEPEVSEIVSFILRPADAAPLGPVLPGQYVSVSLPQDPAGLPRRRSYSISGRPDGRSLRITVRRLGKGGFSDVLHQTLRPGVQVLLGPPQGGFVLDSAPGRDVVLGSAGVGITPLLPMLEALVTTEAPGRIWFVHGARHGGLHLFADEAAGLAARARPGRVTLVSAYSRPRTVDAPDHAGRIDAALLAGLTDPAAADFYLCGPAGFMDDLRAGLVERGADPSAIRTEAFEAGQDGALASAMGRHRQARVTFAKSDRVATWTPERGTLLDLAVSEGLDLPHSCRMGDCQSCLQRILAGRVDHPALTALDLVPGLATLCQALPDGDVTLDC